MSFTARDYLDNEYLNFQEFISTLSVSIPSLKPNTFKDEKQLLRSVIAQNKAYAKKIIDLFEELSKEIFSTSNGTSRKESEVTTKVNSPNRGTTGRTKSSSSPNKGDLPQSKENKLSHLEKKIEYLNNFATESKKALDEKTKELESVSKKYKDLLVQHNQALEEKGNLKDQLKEMLDISDNLKNKFDIHLEDIMIEKDKEIADLKKQVEDFARKADDNDFEGIRSSYGDVSDLKNKLYEKEREIALLKSDLLALENQDSSRKSLTPNLIFEIFAKVKQLGIKLDDLNILLNKVCDKYHVEVINDPGFKRLVELSELKGDQISQILNPIYFNKIEDMKVQIEKLWDRIEFEVATSPSRPEKIDFNQTATLKENISMVREEIQEQLKSTAIKFEHTNNAEFFQELQQEIEKNYELQQTLDDLKKSVNKVGVIVIDEFDRLAALFEITDKVEIADFKNQIDSAKKRLVDFVEKNTCEPLFVNAEYENQKKRWHEKIVQQAEIYNQEVQKLKAVVENERLGNDKSIDKIKSEKDKLKADIAEIESNYKQAEDRFVAKISKLETELNTQKEKIKALKNDADVYEKLIQEREETILNYSQTINVWQDKCTSIEAENLKLLHENSKFRGVLIEKEREAELHKENSKKLMNEKTEQEKAQEAKTEEVNLIKVEIDMLKDKLKEVQQEAEDEKLSLLEKYKALETQHNDYVAKQEAKMNETRIDYEEALKVYRTQLDEKKSALEQIKNAYQEEIKAKNDEIRQYVNTNRSADELTKSQAAGIRNRDEKIAQQADEIKELQYKVKGLEIQLEEFTSLKDKSKKYFDMLTTSSREVTALKGDIQKALHERNDTLAKCNRLESQVQELKDELIRTKDQYQTARQLIEDYKTQIHNSKIELEASHTRLLNREKELKEFEETNLAQSKSTILYKDETILRLKSDVKFLTEKLEDLQREYQKIIEKNEDLLFDNQKLKHLALESELGLSAAEKLNNINDDLCVQIEELKRKLQEKEDSFNQERGYLKKDLSAAQKKILELEKKVAKDEKAFKR